MTALLVPRCPFVNLPTGKTSHWGEGITRKEMETLRWVRPQLVAEVAFTEWTRDGNLRHAAFAGLREDKPANQVHRETDG
jgi:bifunctional non-homologous end joining protein LigD